MMQLVFQQVDLTDKYCWRIFSHVELAHKVMAGKDIVSVCVYTRLVPHGN